MTDGQPVYRAGEAMPTLRSLLSRAELGLRPVIGEDELDAGAFDHDIRWVHSSDLSDPTPFLSEGLALLTTGTQFAAGDVGDGAGAGVGGRAGGDAGADGPERTSDLADAAAYVDRLVARGVVALGFGTEVARDGVPAALEAACRNRRMPLFEVPYRTPFIAVARANAEAVAAAAYARRSWALAAQRAISLAALRPDGLRATIAELARQLDGWVGLYDAGGALGHESPAGSLPRGVRDAVATQAAAMLHRGQGAAASFDAAAHTVSLQSIGRGRHLRGVLAVASTPLDAEARGVVNAVVAMVGLALEQSRAVRRARDELRAAVVRALLAGDLELAGRVEPALGALPEGGVRVGVLDRAVAAPDAVTEWLEARGAVFGAAGDELVVVSSDDGVFRDLAAEFDLRIGVSAPAALSSTGDAAAQARVALAAVDEGVGVFRADDGVLAASSPAEARVRASALLAPLRTHDAATGSDLVETLRVWLELDGGNEAAARRLGVHRHTVRSRVAAIERVLGHPLDTFPARAELWAALRLAP